MINRTSICNHFERMFNAGVNNLCRARDTLKLVTHLLKWIFKQ